MVTIRAGIVGTEELAAALRRYGQRAEAEIGRAVLAHAVDVRSDIQRRYQRGPATGRQYQRGATVHQASAPGEAPATDTGTLASSVTFRKTGPMTAEVESRVPYAVMLETGTARMDPRPAWVPAIEAKRSGFEQRVANAIIRARGSGL